VGKKQWWHKEARTNENSDIKRRTAMKPVQPSPNNGGQPVPIPKVNMNPIQAKNTRAKEPDWEGYSNPPRGSNKGDVWGKK